MIECGFEFEFGHDVSLDFIKQLIKLHYPKNKLYTITDDSYSDVLMSKNYFIFKNDASVHVNNCKNICTEMCTPVFSGKRNILQNFQKIFAILEILNVNTNFTCSLHVNVGFSEETEIDKINMGKLYVFFNEHANLKNFKRSKNTYCKPCIPISKCKQLLEGSDKEIIRKLEKYLLFLEKSHNRAIALDKCKNNKISIIEFRIIGGDYINNFEKSYDLLQRILDSMYFSIGRLDKITIKQKIEQLKCFMKNI